MSRTRADTLLVSRGVLREPRQGAGRGPAGTRRRRRRDRAQGIGGQIPRPRAIEGARGPTPWCRGAGEAGSRARRPSGSTLRASPASTSAPPPAASPSASGRAARRGRAIERRGANQLPRACARSAASLRAGCDGAPSTSPPLPFSRRPHRERRGSSAHQPSPRCPNQARRRGPGSWRLSKPQSRGPGAPHSYPARPGGDGAGASGSARGHRRWVAARGWRCSGAAVPHHQVATAIMKS